MRVDRGLRLAGRVAGRGAAVDVGGEEAVVAHGALRPGARLHLQQRRQRHHLAASRAHLQLADVVGARAELRVRLHAHRIGAAEPVEVVDVERAEIDLQRVEHVGHRDAELARLGAVDVGIELRHVDLVAGEQAGELRRRRGLGQERLGRLVERLVAEAGAVLDLQLEAADRAEPLHRRRREHRDEGFLDAGELLVQLLGDRGAAQLGASCAPRTA